MPTTPDSVAEYRLEKKNRAIYLGFIVFKLIILFLVLYEGFTIYDKFRFHPEYSNFAGLFILTEALIIIALLYSLYKVIPSYGNNLSVIKALTYRILLSPDCLTIYEHKWARALEIPLTDIVSLAFGGYLIFRGGKLNKKFLLTPKSPLKYVEKEYILGLLEETKDELYYYRLNMAFIDNYVALRERLLSLNPAIQLYEPALADFEEKTDKDE